MEIIQKLCGCVNQYFLERPDLLCHVNICFNSVQEYNAEKKIDKICFLCQAKALFLFIFCLFMLCNN